MKITTFNKFVSERGKAEMVLENHCGDLVLLTDCHGTTHKCWIVTTSTTPDDEPLVVIDPVPAEKNGRGYVFASDIVSVETIKEG
jgi:hypothetical protein